VIKEFFMAILGVKVPHEVSRALGSIAVPGDNVSGEEKHVTLIHFGSKVPIDTITKAIVAVYDVAAKTVPFSLLMSEVSCFPKGVEGIPIITRIESPELHKLRAGICESLDKAGVDYSKKFPEYSPHITLSYSTELIEPFQIRPCEWTAYEMVLWGGDQGDGRISVNFPFSLPGKQALIRKLVQAFVRFSS
jgi:2'-5' RNA ligase